MKIHSRSEKKENRAIEIILSFISISHRDTKDSK